MKLFRRNKTKRERLNKSEQGSSGGRFGALNLYTRLIADKWTKGRTDNPTDRLEGDQVLGDKNFYYSVNRVFTSKGVKKPYFIALPEYIDRGFITDVRDEVDRVVTNYNQTNDMNENVSVTGIARGKNYDLDLSQGKMQGRFRMWSRQYEKIQSKAQNSKLEDELKSDKHTEDTRRKVGSYLYMKEAVEEEKASFYKTNFLIELVATSDEILDDADKAIKGYFYSSNITAKELFIQTNEYMKVFTPMGSNRTSLLEKMNEGNVYADETISSLTVPTHGIIGDEVGVPHGIDILSRRLVSFNLGKGEDANNILLTAMTGHGKSNFAKMLYTFYPVDPKYSTVVFDYEGDEYKPLAQVNDAEIVALDKSSGKFVNTVVIGRVTGNEEIDVELKTEAQTSTVRIFNLLVDAEDGMTSEQVSVLSEAIKEVYIDFGVLEDRDTWIKSENITFFHLYHKISMFLNHEYYSTTRERYGRDLLNNFINILRPFFEEGEIYKHWFQESISVQELLDKKNIVFSFGMGSSTESMEDGKSLALRQLFASHITTLKANHNKKNGVRTVVFLEELQRYLKLKYSGDLIAKFTSGGRKNGMINYLITNSPNELLQLKDSYSDEIRKNASTIMSNITMQIIGAHLKGAMDNLIDEYGLENSRGVLYQLAEVAERGSKEQGGLKYCFYVRYGGQSAILRMLSHPALEELPLYRTLEKEKEDGETYRTVETTDMGNIQKGLEEAEKEDAEKRLEEEDFEGYRKGSTNTRGIWQRGNHVEDK